MATKGMFGDYRFHSLYNDLVGECLSRFRASIIPESEQAYINGVKTGYTHREHGNKAVNDAHTDEFSNGLICGMGMSEREYTEFINKHEERIGRRKDPSVHKRYDLYEAYDRKIKYR